MRTGGGRAVGLFLSLPRCFSLEAGLDSELILVMRPVTAVFIFVLAVFIGGALLAPPLCWGIQFAASQTGALTSLAQQPFHRYVTRSMMVIAVGGMVPLLKLLGARTSEELGWRPRAGTGKQLVLGMSIGFGSLAVVAGCAAWFGARTWDGAHSSAEVAKHIRNALLAALLVSPVEEMVFRAGLFGGLRRGGSVRMAIVVSSAIYALVHFFQRAELHGEIHWFSGFSVLAEMLKGFGDVNQLVPGFFNLALAGVILAWGYQRLGTLYFSMGLHAGWIFWLKTYAFLTKDVPGHSTWFWGTGKLIDGWFAGIVLASVLVASARWIKPSHPKGQR